MTYANSTKFQIIRVSDNVHCLKDPEILNTLLVTLNRAQELKQKNFIFLELTAYIAIQIDTALVKISFTLCISI